jgi:signal transduction histidine kinase
MKPKSLRLRLMAMAAVAIGAALALAWAALSLLFERHLERQAQSDLERLGGVLVAGVTFNEAGALRLAAEPSDPRFQTPGSGLYWRLSTESNALSSRSLWDGVLPGADAARGDAWTAVVGKGPFEDEVMQVMRRIRPSADGAAVLVQIAEDHGAVDAAQAGFAGELGLSLAILWAALLAAAWAQIVWGLQPLGAVRRALDALRTDPTARLKQTDFPAEVAPLADEINKLADARAADMVRARSRAQDLAHALKTPLTALKLQVADLPDHLRIELDRSLVVLQQAIGAELAASAPARLDSAVRCLIAPMMDRLIAVIGRAHAGRNVRITNECAPFHGAPITQDVALELFGAVLDNAAKHARALVRISSQAADGQIQIAIDDDGPGIPDEQMHQAVQRGARLDQRGAGQGLGLAIATDLAQSTGGDLHLSRSALGGLCVRVTWPIAR